MSALLQGDDVQPVVPPGLSSAEAAAELLRVGPNRLVGQRATPLWRRIVAQLRDPLILVLLAAAGLTVATGDLTDAAVIALVVGVNTTVGVLQEVRADHAVAALSALSAPQARVTRDGHEQLLPTEQLVPGDAVLLAEGDVVPADGIVLEASALLVDESALTGESLPVDKVVALPGQPDEALAAGTIVVRGRALVRVTATGPASALGRIAALLDTAVQVTPLQRRLSGLGGVLAVAVIGLCLVVLVLGLLRGEPFELMLITAISLVVAAVPESLPAVVTLSLALGAARMAARHAVVRRLAAVETLGSVAVLATDKTGTLTQGRMVAEQIWTSAGANVSVTGSGYQQQGQLLVDGSPVAVGEVPGLRPLLVAAVLCNDARLPPPVDPADRSDGDAQAPEVLGDPTEAALLVVGAKAGLDRADLERSHPRSSEVPFDSSRKRMTTIHPLPGGGLLVCTKGALEGLVADDLLQGTPPDVVAAALDQSEALAADGYRVLAVATRRLDVRPEDLEDGTAAVERCLSLLGVVAIADPPKQSAAGVIASCRAAGIIPVLITGDHPATALSIARRLGLVDDAAGGPGDATEVVTGADLRAAGGVDLTAHRLFARTTPKQKLDIVAAWQARGMVVAMTGDGVNDGPALRRADIGVAMGRRGTEVARQAADLVLDDDELGTVVVAVEEGRRVYANIRRFLGYALSGGAAEILVMLLGPALGLATPLLPAQILWINLLTHGLTGVALGAEPLPPGAMTRPPRPSGQSILGDGLWQRVLWLSGVVTAVSLAAAAWGSGDDRSWQSLLFLSLTTAQLGVALGSRARPLGTDNPWMMVAVAGSLLLVLAGVYLPVLQELLGTQPLGGRELLVALAAGVVGLLAVLAARRARPAR